MTGEDENVMKIASYEDGDWILNYFDNGVEILVSREGKILSTLY